MPGDVVGPVTVGGRASWKAALFGNCAPNSLLKKVGVAHAKAWVSSRRTTVAHRVSLR
ncbi:hypothetical protein [Micromonospora coxensis]|uniref:hypothetical protein n=1 Tax=Micromonospora coxensis TaxID=356852 RepID=UPI0012FD1ED1|nr:hypothetical protein [Micromonospora coxensis]